MPCATAAGNLSFDKRRINHDTAVVHHDVAINSYLAGRDIDINDHAVRAARERAPCGPMVLRSREGRARRRV